MVPSLSRALSAEAELGRLGDVACFLSIVTKSSGFGACHSDCELHFTVFCLRASPVLKQFTESQLLFNTCFQMVSFNRWEPPSCCWHFSGEGGGAGVRMEEDGRGTAPQGIRQAGGILQAEGSWLRCRCEQKNGLKHIFAIPEKACSLADLPFSRKLPDPPAALGNTSHFSSLPAPFFPAFKPNVLKGALIVP